MRIARQILDQKSVRACWRKKALKLTPDRGRQMGLRNRHGFLGESAPFVDIAGVGIPKYADRL
jgi:hypothetical protein